MNIQRRLFAYFVIFILSFVLILWTIYFFKTHEKRITTQIDYSNPLAQYNNFLAASLLLEKLHIEAKTVMGRKYLIQPPSENGLLVIPRIDADLKVDKIEQLWQWINQGGHLITTINTKSSYGKKEEKQQQKGFLARLNIQTMSKYRYIFDNETLQTCEAPAAKSDDKDSTDIEKITQKDVEDITWKSQIKIPIHDEIFSLSVYVNKLLFDPDKKAQWGIKVANEGYFLLHYQQGKGQITVLNDLDLFENEHIHLKNNSLLFALLAEDKKKAWFLINTDANSIFSLLTKNMPIFSALFAVFLILLLWQQRHYTGGKKHLTDHQRHNLMDHLYASANYRWHLDKNAALLQKNQKNVEQHWLRRYPIMQQQNQLQRCQWIAKHSQLNVLEIKDALYIAPDNVSAFIQISHYLQILSTE